MSDAVATTNPARAVTEKDRSRAQKCLDCAICGHARKKQGGIVYALLRLENRICPRAKAYERVYGRKALDRIPGE